MTIDAITTYWPALLVLTYVFATCVLNVLTAYRKRAIEEHDLLVQTRIRRREYIMAIESRVQEREQREAEKQASADLSTSN